MWVLAKNSGPNPRSLPKIIDKTPLIFFFALKRVCTPPFRLYTDPGVWWFGGLRDVTGSVVFDRARDALSDGIRNP